MWGLFHGGLLSGFFERAFLAQGYASGRFVLFCSVGVGVFNVSWDVSKVRIQCGHHVSIDAYYDNYVCL
jgi:hypothetical protein